VKTAETVVASVFALLGIRSLVYWARRPFEGRDPVDHALYALYLTGRVGLWFAFAGAFALFASITTRGQAFVDDVRGYRWYLLVFVILGVIQLVAGWFLGRRAPRDANGASR
jgi:cytochrome bd-type quinol oxidase subunit 1